MNRSYPACHLRRCQRLASLGNACRIEALKQNIPIAAAGMLARPDDNVIAGRLIHRHGLPRLSDRLLVILRSRVNLELRAHRRSV